MFAVQVERKALVCHLQVEDVPRRSRGGNLLRVWKTRSRDQFIDNDCFIFKNVQMAQATILTILRVWKTILREKDQFVDDDCFMFRWRETESQSRNSPPSFTSASPAWTR